MVTVLYCMPVEAPAGAARPEPDARYLRMRDLYALARVAVQRYGGTLHPVVGEHIITVFERRRPRRIMPNAPCWQPWNCGESAKLAPLARPSPVTFRRCTWGGTHARWLQVGSMVIRLRPARWWGTQ